MTNFEDFLRRQIIAWFSSESAAYAVLGDLDSRVQHIARNWEQVQQAEEQEAEETGAPISLPLQPPLLWSDLEQEKYSMAGFSILVDYGLSGDEARELLRRIGVPQSSGEARFAEAESDDEGVVCYQECFCGDAGTEHYAHGLQPCRKCHCIRFRFKRWNPAPPVTGRDPTWEVV